jgi:hypothetical protein
MVKDGKQAIMERTEKVRNYLRAQRPNSVIYTDKLKDGRRSVKSVGMHYSTLKKAQAAAGAACAATGDVWKAVKRQGNPYYSGNVGYTIRAYV